MSLVFKYKKIERPPPIPPIFSPVIPVTLKSENEQVDVIALVDSGADTCAIPKGIAEILSLDLSGEIKPVLGVGGEGKCITTKVTVIVQHGHEKYMIPVELKVILDSHDKFPVILGRKDFFEYFEITFKEIEKKIALKKVYQK